MMSPLARIGLALTTSLLLHLALLAGSVPVAAPPKPPRIEARLQLPEPPAPAEPAPPSEPDPDIFRKNTLAPEKPVAPPPPKPSTATSKPSRLKAAEEQHALRTLSEYVLYPQAAIDANHEGTVHLLLKLDTNGTILHASVAASSGHAELDHAALQAALKAGRLNTGGRTEFILPITFRLQ